MFNGRKAWFSQSVERPLRDLWEAEGGVITNHYYAEYLFSSDASHHDTQRIYHSLAYVEDKATVFHSSFLQANSRSEIRSLVSLGHFILPPICLHEEIKRRIGSFIWEQESSSSPIEQQMETHSGRKRDGKEDKQRVSPECEIRKEMAGSDSAGSEELTYYTLQNYPVNNMLIGYISIDEMKKFPGELHDFTPSTAEYLAYRVQDESDIFSVVKRILNKK